MPRHRAGTHREGQDAWGEDDKRAHVRLRSRENRTEGGLWHSSDFKGRSFESRMNAASYAPALPLAK